MDKELGMTQMEVATQLTVALVSASKFALRRAMEDNAAEVVKAFKVIYAGVKEATPQKAE